MEFLTKYQSVWKKVGIIGLVYLGMKYLVPLVIPFLIAAAAAWWLRPVFLKLQKWCRIKPSISAFLFLALAVGIIGLAIYFVGGQLWQLGNQFFGSKDAGVYVEQMLVDCCQAAERLLGFPAEQVERVVLAQVQVLTDKFQGSWLQSAMGGSWTAVKSVGKVVAAVLITAISFVLWSADFEKIKEEASGSAIWKKLVSLGKGILGAIGGYVKAQCIIIGIIMVICVVGFFLAGSPYALVLGILTGFLDALPVLGTGLVILPWLIVQVIQGNYMTAVILGLTYGACALTRELLEPRLVGKRLGLFPILVLMSVYVGVKVYGAGGIVLGPLSLLIIQELWKETSLSP